MTSEELRNCYHADLLTCRAVNLADLKQISITRDIPLQQRTEHYMEQVKNPYLFRVDQTIVKVTYGGNRDLSSVLVNLLMRN